MAITNDIAVILDLGPRRQVPDEWWQHAGLDRRLLTVFENGIVIGGDAVADFRPAADFEDALKQARACGSTAIAYVGADQLFLDTSVMVRAAKIFAKHQPDLCSQWEHASLPIGCGLRVARLEAVEASGAESFAAFIEDVHAGGLNYRVAYDDHLYSDYETALLDARINAALLEAAKSPGNVSAWSLDGFLEMAAACDYRKPAVTPAEKTDSDHVDERHMPSTFGFEAHYTADFPSYVMFDLTNKCNAACIHCPQSTGFLGQEHTVFLDYDLYCKAIDECVGQQIDFVRITADGEPLLHPRVYDMIGYASARGVGPIGLTTNGSALNEQNINRLLDADLDVIDISLDAFSPEVFEVVRAGLSYARTVKNAHRFLELKAERHHHVKVMVSFVKQKENSHELDAFKDYWEPRVDRVLVREMISNVGLVDVDGSVEDSETDRWPCPHWFRRVVINYDGSIKACPIDWQNGTVCGSLRDGTLASVWHNEHYRKNRLEHMNNEYSSDSICRNCRDWRGTPWNLGYEKVIRDLKSA